MEIIWRASQPLLNFSPTGNVLETSVGRFLDLFLDVASRGWYFALVFLGSLRNGEGSSGLQKIEIIRTIPESLVQKI